MSVHKKSLQQLFLYGFTSLNLSALYFEFPIERVKVQISDILLENIQGGYKKDGEDT